MSRVSVREITIRAFYGTFSQRALAAVGIIGSTMLLNHLDAWLEIMNEPNMATYVGNVVGCGLIFGLAHVLRRKN